MKNTLLAFCSLSLFFSLSCYASSNTALKSKNNTHTMVDGGTLIEGWNPLSNSIVGIAVPKTYKNGQIFLWETSCTGTIIARNFVLTAGHCVANYDIGSGEFLKSIQDTQTLFVLPSKDGAIVKTLYPTDNMTLKYKVRAIYLPHDYNYSNLPGTLRPRPYYINQDFALLELEEPLPLKYRPINLDENSQNAKTDISLVGYGLPNPDPDYWTHRNLRQAPIHFISDRQSGSAIDYKQIYTTANQPIKIPDTTIYKACNNNEDGDDGAPILHRNQAGVYSLAGIYSMNLYTGKAMSAFCAEMPTPVSANVSIASNYSLLRSIIDDTNLPFTTKCLAFSGVCDSYIYTSNTDNNTISQLKLSRVTGKLIGMGAVTNIGLRRPIMTLLNPGIGGQHINKNHFLVVLNQGANERDKGYLVSYRVNQQDGSLTPVNSVETNQSPLSMAFSNNGNSIFEVAAPNIITVFSFNQETGEIIKRQEIKRQDIKGPLYSITVSQTTNSVYIPSYNDQRALIYKYIDYDGGRLQPLSVSPEYSMIVTGVGPIQIALSPKEDFALILNADSSIILYKIKKVDDGIQPVGSLSLIKDAVFKTGEAETKMLIAPRDEYHADVYMGSVYNFGIKWYTLDYHEEKLVPNQSIFFGYNILDMAIDKTGSGVFITTLGGEKNIYRFRRDTETGQLFGFTSSVKIGAYPISMTILE